MKNKRRDSHMIGLPQGYRDSPYYPLYRKETNNINMHLLEKHQKLLRERNITKTYNNVFRRQHAWHPYTFKMRERHERHHGHEGEIDDKSVPSKHKITYETIRM